MVGTKDFALPTFERLLDDGFNIVALVTQPERPQGRRQELVPAAIKQLALSRGVAVLQPESINAPDSLETIRGLAPTILVTAAYGQILSADLLAIPPLGAINLHGSVLPAYRGAAPVARAIQRGEVETGVTVIQMSTRVDAGGILAIAKTPIDPDETAEALESRLAALGAPLVADTLRQIFAGTIQPLPQDRSRVSKAPKLTKDDANIDWTRDAREIHNLVRAMQPWPCASTQWQSGDPPSSLRLLIHRTEVVDQAAPPGAIISADGNDLIVGTGSGAIRILIVQAPGKRAMTAAEFLRGNRLDPAGGFA